MVNLALLLFLTAISAITKDMISSATTAHHDQYAISWAAAAQKDWS